MKLVPYHGVLLKEYVREILKSYDKFQVVPSSMKVFPTNFNGHLSPTVSRPSEGRTDRDTVGTGYVWINGWVNNREAGDLRRYRAHHDVTVMKGYYKSRCALVKYEKLVIQWHSKYSSLTKT